MLDIRRRKPQIRQEDGREIRDTGECHYRKWGIIGCLGRDRDLVGEDAYVANQHPTKNGRRIGRRGDTGEFYRVRCSRVPDLEHVWQTGPRKDCNPALCDAKERAGKASTQNNMGAGKFELLLCRLSRKYKECGQNVVVHFDDAACRSRKRDHWVSRVEVEEGEVAKMGIGRGWGACVVRSARTGLLVLQLNWRRKWQKRDAGEPWRRPEV